MSMQVKCIHVRLVLQCEQTAEVFILDRVEITFVFSLFIDLNNEPMNKAGNQSAVEKSSNDKLQKMPPTKAS